MRLSAVPMLLAGFPALVAAEARKAATLPATAAALAVAVGGSIAITLINSFSVRNALDSGRADLVGYTTAAEAAFSAVPLGTVGAAVIGVVVVGSEYTLNNSDTGGGRQITSTLAAAPRRVSLLTAKAVVVMALVAASAILALPASLTLAGAVLGDAATTAPPAAEVVARSVGAAGYWMSTGLIALALTVATRSGIVPMIFLIVNSSLVSFSLLLSHVTPLARYLPDMAGIGMFAGDFVAVDNALAPLTGALVMGGWTLGLLVVAALVLHRRDA